MESGVVKYVCSFAIGLGLLCAAAVTAQQSGDLPDVPSQFKLDTTTAARLRPQLMAQSSPASGRYNMGRIVFDRLIAQIRDPYHGKIEWQLRIVDDNQLNAYSSPDGSVYVESGLASLAGSSAGLWAAILSHEIAHVVHRDWARRYLYQKYLEKGGGAAIVLGDPSLPSISWETSEKASADMGRFGRQMELEADREGLMMMAHAGYHPDFVPAMHHLLHARGMGANKRSMYAMHPCWEERDRELTHAYVEASIEFAREWPEWYASPGGNPPVVVFADEPTVRKTSGKEWQIQVPMRCQNLAGAVEVVLGSAPPRPGAANPDQPKFDGEADPNLRQLTGCTSPKTTITFALGEAALRQKPGTPWTDIYVLDSRGSVLARAELPKLPH
ncbi:MAG: M48 family metalloprotease [Candidatus Sulfotelmatobacter sp.]